MSVRKKAEEGGKKGRTERAKKGSSCVSCRRNHRGACSHSQSSPLLRKRNVSVRTPAAVRIEEPQQRALDGVCTFPLEAIQNGFRLLAIPTEEPLDASQLRGWSEWRINFTTPIRVIGTLSFEYPKYPSLLNDTSNSLLDDAVCRIFPQLLTPSSEASQLVSQASLAGTYAHIICSATYSTEKEEIYLDRIPQNNIGLGSNPHTQLNCVLASRFGELASQVLAAIRHPQSKEADLFQKDAYAAAVILYYKVHYFQFSLSRSRKGHLSDQIPHRLPTVLYHWLTDTEAELRLFIDEEAPRFLDWQSPIVGSMKSFDKQYRHETFTLEIEVQHNLTTSAFALPGPMNIDEWIPEASYPYQEMLTPSTFHDSNPVDWGIDANLSLYSSLLLAVNQDQPTSYTNDDIQNGYLLDSSLDNTDLDLILEDEAPSTFLDSRTLVSNNEMTSQGPYRSALN